MFSSDEIRKKFIEFHEKNGHKLVPNVSLVPEGDSTLLFVNSGMFPLAPYLGGEKHPLGSRLTNLQRCLRVKYDELIEVGDNRHTLMFEMMGNWSLGDYFKKEQIPWVMDLHVNVYGLDPTRLYVSVWEGNDLVPRDDESIELWKEAFRKYGVEAEYSDNITDIPGSLEEGLDHKIKIFPYGKSDNWWQRGEAPGELGGPTTEIFFDTGLIEREQDEYHINDDSGRFLEIGNSVFMEYYLDDEMNWQQLEQKNVDFGGGLERVMMAVQDKKDIYETDIYMPIIKQIEKLSGKEYKTTGELNEYTAPFRIISDHSRAAVFILADGVTPSNKDQGYILRRFIRRLVRFGLKLELGGIFTSHLAEFVIDRMKDAYPHLEKNRKLILQEMEAEEVKFKKTLEKGLREINKLRDKGTNLNGIVGFDIFQTYGYPIEMTIEEFGLSEDEAEKILAEYDAEVQSHREKSRAGVDKKFKGGLADQSEQTTKYHTATHLLNAALREIVGEHVYQKGSNITGERLRFDFPNDSKLTPEQVAEVEAWVNDKIETGYEVSWEEMPLKQAESEGVVGVFGERYGDVVKVFTIGDKNTPISREICGGPHVSNTSELGGKFKIVKQENVGAGVKRIKAIIES